MRKLPRRLPSHSPSLAWVAFAVLFLAIAGGIGGLYAHRQNQETTKQRLITDLEGEIAQLRERTDVLASEFEGRIAAAQLKLAVGDKKMPLAAIDPARRHLVPWEGPSATPPGAPAPSAESQAILATMPARH